MVSMAERNYEIYQKYLGGSKKTSLAQEYNLSKSRIGAVIKQEYLKTIYPANELVKTDAGDKTISILCMALKKRNIQSKEDLAKLDIHEAMQLVSNRSTDSMKYISILYMNAIQNKDI